MAVPKKRTSKLKSRNRKTLWKKKAFQKVIQCFLKFANTNKS